MIVADLVATLSLDDQMSAGLAKAGQQLDALAARGGKIAGEVLSTRQSQPGQSAKPNGKVSTFDFDYGGATEMAARLGRALAEVSAESIDLAAAENAATALSESLSGLTVELGQLAIASDNAAASLSTLSGVLREIAAVAVPEKGKGQAPSEDAPAQDPWDPFGHVADFLAILEFIPTKILPTIAKRVVGGIGSAIILAYETNFLGFADALNNALAEVEGDTVTIRATPGQIVVDSATWANPAVQDSLLKAAAENNIGDKGPYSVTSGLAPTWDQSSGYSAVEDNRAAASQMWWDGALPGPQLAAGHGADYSWLDPLYDEAEARRKAEKEINDRADQMAFDKSVSDFFLSGGRQTELEHVFGDASRSGTETIPATSGTITADAATWGNPAVRDSLLKAAEENNIGDVGPYVEGSRDVPTWDQLHGYSTLEDNRAAASQLWSGGTAADLTTGAMDIQATAVTVTAQTTKLANAGPLAMPESLPGTTNRTPTGEAVPTPGLGGVPSPATASAVSGMSAQIDAAIQAEELLQEDIRRLQAAKAETKALLAQTASYPSGTTLEQAMPVGSGEVADAFGATGPDGALWQHPAEDGFLPTTDPYVSQLPQPQGMTGTRAAGASGAGQVVMAEAQRIVAEINAAVPPAVAMIQQAMSAAMAQLQQAASGAMATGGMGATAALPAPAAAMPATPMPAGMGPGGGAGGPATAPAAGGGGAIASQISAEMSAAASAAQAGGQQIATAMQSAATAAQTGAQQIVAAVQSIGPALSAAAANAGATAGTIGDAIVAALEADLGAVQAAAAALGSAAQAGLQSTVQPGSPSRMAIPYGQSIGEGLAFGMQQKSPEVLAAAEKLGYSAEQGLQPLMDGMSMTGLAAGKALGVDMEQALAQQVNGMEGWDPKSQIDHEALLAFQDAAVKMARYGKRAGDDAASKAGEAFKGLADNMSAVLMGSETYLSDELAKDALMAYRKLDAEAKAKLPDGIKEQLKATYDEANITIGDVIQQRMGGRLGEGMDLKGRFKEAKETILRGMLGQRTLEQKAQAAAEDGLSLAIDSIKNGLMQGGQDAQSAMKGAIDSALGGGPGEAMKGGMLESMFGGGAGADPEEFAWALCECISGANQEMLGSLGLGNPAETATAMLGHELSNQIAGTGDEFRSAMLDYAKQNPALNLPTQWLEDESASQCMTICDKTAQEMGGAAGDAAGAAMGAKMPAMPSGADFGKAAGGALGSQMQSQCVSLCGGTTDDLASGVANGVGKGVAELGVEQVTGEMTASGAREMGKQLRGSIPGATMPGMPGASPDDMASGVADGITGQCITLCDDSGMSDAAGSLDSAASGMSDLGGQISQLTQSLVSQKFGETMKGIQDGLSGGGGATGGIPAGVEVPEHIMKLNPNINRALNFDIAQTNPHAAALLGGASPVHLSGGGNPLSGGTPSGFQDSGEQTINVNLNVDGQTLANTSVKYMGRGLGLAMQNARRGGGMMGSRRG